MSGCMLFAAEGATEDRVCGVRSWAWEGRGLGLTELAGLFHACECLGERVLLHANGDPAETAPPGPAGRRLSSELLRQGSARGGRGAGTPASSPSGDYRQRLNVMRIFPSTFFLSIRYPIFFAFCSTYFSEYVFVSSVIHWPL